MLRGQFACEMFILQPLLRSAGHQRRLHLYCGFLCMISSPAAFVQQFAFLVVAQPRLKVLSLAELHLSSLPAERQWFFFSSLHALHMLQLVSCIVNQVLSQEPAAPHLRYPVLFSRLSSTQPSSSALATLQAAMPQLCITDGAWANWSCDAFLLEPTDEV